MHQRRRNKQKKEAFMSIAEIIPPVRALSRCEKFQIAQMLLDELAKEELSAVFKEGDVYPIYTPEFAPQCRDPTDAGVDGN
jgi:hypothetical protein